MSKVFVVTTYGGPEGQQLTEREAPARGLGTFAEHTVLDASATVAKPEEISFADAAAIPVAGTTAYDLTHQVEIEAGHSRGKLVTIP